MALASVVIFSLLATRVYVGYDSFWHVFIARQRGADFWREVAANAHPPLFYLLLKAAMQAFGHSTLVYRAWSIFSIAAATILVATITTRVTATPRWGVLAGITFGLSATAIEIALEVRAYALFTACSLAAIAAYLEWLGARPGRSCGWHRALLAASLSAAILSHYSAAFLLCAMLATPALLALTHRRWRARLRRELSRHGLSVAAMFGLPLSIAALAYLVHLRRAGSLTSELGDPAPGCAKGFAIAWRCGTDRPVRRQVLLPEAGFGSALAITCAGQQPEPARR